MSPVRWILAVLVLAAPLSTGSAKEPFDFPEPGRPTRIAADGAELRGSLLLPSGDGPFPAVVGLVGSGGYTYRDAWIDGHWPFWKELSGLLLDQKIAVLMLEKRGVAGSGGAWKERTLVNRAEDAMAAVRHLQGLVEIDPERIGIAGQSQGGWVAMIAAAVGGEEVAFVLTFAGPAIGVLEQVVDDRVSELRCKQLSESAIEKKKRKYEARLRRFGGVGHLRKIQDYEPGEHLKAVRQPVLAIFAENDELVWADKNTRRLQEAFEESGNSRLWTSIVPGANHAFLYGEPCEPLKGHDGPPSFKDALLNEGFFEAAGLTLDREAAEADR